MDPSDEMKDPAEDAPDDVATLYSWANLHGAKYRDFSASRREHRAQIRRAAREEDARHARHPEREIPTTPPPGFVPDLPAPTPRPEEPTRSPVIYVREYGSPTREREERPWTPPPPPPSFSESLPHVSEERYTHAPSAPLTPPPAAPSRPAWLYSESPAAATPTPFVPAPVSPIEDTLQHSRERVASRWYALKGVFEQQAAEAESAPQPRGRDARVPVLAIFSLAGGVGKTSLTATLGRALASHGERALLVDTAAYGLLPFYFGSRESRPGVMRTFSPPGGTMDAPVHLLTCDVESHRDQVDWLAEELGRAVHGMQRVIIDIPTASASVARQAMRVATAILVPIVPDLNSVVSLGAVDSFFRQHGAAEGRQIQPMYVLNQFDASLPLHLDVREVLRQQLGDRLLPAAIRRNSAVSEALAEGMTVVDYAPSSPVTEDYLNIAAWLRSIAAPASATFRGVRWSER
jgi:cellulose synthase operon protein YhjQ